MFLVTCFKTSDLIFWLWTAGYVGQWLQVDFGQETKIAGVVTQGRPNLDQWVTEYEIHYGSSTTSLQPIMFKGEIVKVI